MMLLKAAAIAALGLCSPVHAQSIAKACPESNSLCYSLNIPDATSGSDSGPIYFQIAAPTSMEWVALGQGSSMSGANIFVMYTSSDGKNVTVSPRLGTGHVEPEHDTATQITLLAGSGVSNGIMTANVRCDNCESWSGGSMDFSGDSGDWIYAYKTGSPLNSNSLFEEITIHNVHSGFTWDFTRAQGGSSVNPFVSSGDSRSSSGSVSGSKTTSLPLCTSGLVTQTLAQPSGATGCPAAWPTEYSSSWPTARPTWASSCFASGYGSWPTNAPWRNDYSNHRRQEQACDDGSGSDTSDSDNNSATFSNANLPFGGNVQKANRIITAHGALAALAFVALFPIGGMLMRIATFTGVLWIHAVAQILTFAIYICAFGMGIYIAIETSQLTEAHPIIGIVLFIVLFFHPLTGFLHHKMFVKNGGRTAWSYEHIGIGRIAILLGMVNGGLGIQLAGDVSQGGKIGYAVCAAVMALLYIAAILFGEMKRRRSLPPSHALSYRRQSRALSSSDLQTPIGLQEYYAKTERG